MKHMSRFSGKYTILGKSYCCCSVAQACPTLFDLMDCSTPGLPVHHQLPEPAQTHVHRVSDAIQPSHPLSSPYPPAFNLSQHQGLFQWVSSSHQVAKVLELQLDHQSLGPPEMMVPPLKIYVVTSPRLLSPLNCKEIQPVHPKGDQSWVFIGRTHVEDETPILWPPDVKSWLIWKYPDAGKD